MRVIRHVAAGVWVLVLMSFYVPGGRWGVVVRLHDTLRPTLVGRHRWRFLAHRSADHLGGFRGVVVDLRRWEHCPRCHQPYQPGEQCGVCR